MPRKEHRLEARISLMALETPLWSLDLKLKKSTVNREEEGGIEARTRMSHSSRDSTMESRLDAKSSGKSTTVNTDKELVNYSPGAKSGLANLCKSSFNIT